MDSTQNPALLTLKPDTLSLVLSDSKAGYPAYALWLLPNLPNAVDIFFKGSRSYIAHCGLKLTKS